jgi:hypothetical protein
MVLLKPVPKLGCALKCQRGLLLFANHRQLYHVGSKASICGQQPSGKLSWLRSVVGTKQSCRSSPCMSAIGEWADLALTPQAAKLRQIQSIGDEVVLALHLAIFFFGTPAYKASISDAKL